MHKSLRKQLFSVTLIGLALLSLACLNLILRQRYEEKAQLVDILQKRLILPVVAARTHLESLTAEPDQTLVAKKILEPVKEVKTILQNIYDEKTNIAEDDINAVNMYRSESVSMLIKLAIVELDRTLGSLEKKAPAVNFDQSLNELQNIVDYFIVQRDRQHNAVEIFSWITIFSVVLSFAGITGWYYFNKRREHTIDLLAADRLAKETHRVDVLSGFIEAMATGDYSIELESDKNDELSTTLVTMRDKLKMNAEDDRRRNWTTTGIAQIGEILRSTNSTSSTLYDNIIKFVVKYTRSNQGGLFILNDEDPQNLFLELVACYAFERKKFLVKHVATGNGLVGQCYLERERIHLREVPQDYVRITSGLGGENPKSCLLVPLKVNDQIYGVLELASFGLYQEFEIELVEKLAESIASTISSVKISERTRILLERTQQQAEEMKSQEEEMRQNMEELSATQEEMQRKEGEYIQRIQELEEQQGVMAR